MRLFHALFWAALAVAVVVGSAHTALMQWWATPIILQAETFEDQKTITGTVTEGNHAHDHATSEPHTHAVAAEGEEGGWAPRDGVERTFWTWVATVLHALALALLGLVALTVRTHLRGPVSSRLFAALGLATAGYISLHLWPSLGLHAEIPGMDAAYLEGRQAWWVLAVASASAACGAIALGRSAWRWAAAAALLALPFAVGVPQLAGDPLAGFSGQAQTALRTLGADFVRVTHMLAVVFWLGLGAACAWAFQRWVQPVLATSIR